MRDDERLGAPRSEDLRGRSEADLMGRAGTSELGRDVRVGGDEGIGTSPAITTSGAAAIPPATSTAASPPSPASSDTREIRSEIEQKRQDISETIDAIQERLAPRNVVSQAAGSVKEATMDKMRQMADAASDTAGQVAGRTRDMASTMATRVRDNPWPVVAAVGLGVGAWWVMNRRARAAETWDDVDTYDYEYDYDYGEETLYADEDLYTGRRWLSRGNAVPLALAGAGLAWWAWNSRRPGNGWGTRYEYGSAGADAGAYRSFPEAAEGAATRVRQAVNEASDRARHAVGEATDRARHVVSEAGDRARHAVSDATGRAREAVTGVGARTRAMATRAQHQVGAAGRRATTQLQHWMDTNPLAVGAAAMAMGVAVGLALPETHRERELMGEARDNLVGRAQEMAGQAVEKAEEKVRDAGQ